MFLISVLLHLIDDFVLQIACFSKLKQKQWWIRECEKENINFLPYKNDYKVALFLHGLEWSIMISLPIIMIGNCNDILLGIIVFINAIIHAIIDHIKANLFKINLIIDQSLHFIQIVFLYAVINFIN